MKAVNIISYNHYITGYLFHECLPRLTKITEPVAQTVSLNDRKLEPFISPSVQFITSGLLKPVRRPIKDVLTANR